MKSAAGWADEEEEEEVKEERKAKKNPEAPPTTSALLATANKAEVTHEVTKVTLHPHPFLSCVALKKVLPTVGFNRKKKQ